MPFSTARRESLIPGVYLFYIALLLGVGFFLLKPSVDTYRFEDPVVARPSAEPIDELDLAFLKARSAKEPLPAEEVRAMTYAMIRAQRWEEALQLLDSRPDVKLDAGDQFLLDLEMSNMRFVNSENETAAATYRSQLLTQLTRLLNDQSLQQMPIVSRGMQLSEQLAQPEITAAIYLQLAALDSGNGAQWNEKCATILSQNQLHGQSLSCFRSAIALNDNREERYDLSVRMISAMAALGDVQGQQQTLETLIGNPPKDVDKLTQLATLALAANRPDLAYPVYARLADADTERQIFWLEKAAKWSLASNLPGLSAEYVQSIAMLSGDESQPELNRRRQTLLLAAGRNDDALQTMRQRIDAEPANGELLQEAIELATQIGLRADAMDWNLELLEVRPFDVEAMKRQIQFAQANKQLDDARYWAQRALTQEPNNRQFRVQLAQLEEWTGNQSEALTHWKWLAGRYPNEEFLRQQIRLSQLTWQLGLAADGYQQLAALRPLSDADLLKMIDLFEQDGRPADAAAALSQHIDRYGNTAMAQRELALLHQRHMNYQQALAAWEDLASSYGHSGEESLNRMELHWRLHQPETATIIAERLQNLDISQASNYQLKLISEIGWRYRKPDIITAALDQLEVLDVDEPQRVALGRRVVRAMRDKQDYEGAVAQAENFWRETQDETFLTEALNIVFQHDLYPHVERYLDANDELIVLRDMPGYWVSAAAYHVSNADTVAAEQAFDETLSREPDNVAAVTGKFWLQLGQPDSDKLLALMNKHLDTAAETPELWAPYALAHMKLKTPQDSLQWFNKIMERDEHDYNLLLTFADALDQVGNTDHAYKVRQYTMRKLRPAIAQSTRGQTRDLASSYANLLVAHGTVAENERWIQSLMDGEAAKTASEEFWREEIAIAWYLSTQRHEYARLLMTRLHEERIDTPVWQELALALHDDDVPKLQEILASGKPLEDTDELAALSQLGRDKDAFALAQQTMLTSKSQAARQVARNQYVALRNYRPAYYAGNVQHTDLSDLGITETSLSLRHTPAHGDYSFGIDVAENQLNSDKFALPDSGTETEIAITARYGDSRSGASVTTGVVSTDDNVFPYVKGDYYKRDRQGRRAFNANASINAPTSASPELRIAGLQHQAEASYEHDVGSHEYVRLGGSVQSLNSRVERDSISTGVGASLEVGRKGSFGSNSWRLGLQATGQQNERADRIPDELRVTPTTTLEEMIPENASRLAISGSLQRGGIRSDYPQAASPRYHVTASLGRTWPFNTVGFAVEAGAGFRVLGDDELSLQLRHDTQTQLQGAATSSTSQIGIQYRSHF